MKIANFLLPFVLSFSGTAAPGFASETGLASTGEGPVLAATLHAELAATSSLSDEPGATLASVSYFYVLGAQLLPRDTATTYQYDLNGCLHQTAGTPNSRLTFPLLLPTGSTIRFVRVIFVDTNAADNLTVFLTRYEAGETNLDLASVSSSGSSGLGSSLSLELSELFASQYNYSLMVDLGVSDASLQICGVRVAYYTPLIFRDGFGNGTSGYWSAVVP